MNIINKLSLSLVTLSLFVVGCQKKETDVDPRDQYVGTYSMALTTTSSAVGSGIQSTLTTNSGNADILISKATDNNQLKISVTGAGDLYANLDNSSFEIPQQFTTSKTNTGYQYYNYYTGSGLFSGNKLTFSVSVDAKADVFTAKTITIFKGTKK